MRRLHLRLRTQEQREYVPIENHVSRLRRQAKGNFISKKKKLSVGCTCACVRRIKRIIFQLKIKKAVFDGKQKSTLIKEEKVKRRLHLRLRTQDQKNHFRNENHVSRL